MYTEGQNSFTRYLNNPLSGGTSADHLEVARRGPVLGRTSGMSDVIQDGEGVRPCVIVSVSSLPSL